MTRRGAALQALMYQQVQVLIVDDIVAGKPLDILKGAVIVSCEEKAQKTLATDAKKKGMSSLFGG